MIHIIGIKDKVDLSQVPTLGLQPPPYWKVCITQQRCPLHNFEPILAFIGAKIQSSLRILQTFQSDSHLVPYSRQFTFTFM